MASMVGGEKGKTILGVFLERMRDSLTSDRVEQSVVDALVDKELTKRTQAIVTCFENFQKLASELVKIDRPDQKVYDDGKEKLFMSSTRHEEIKKLREKIDKHERSLDKAVKGDMKDVYDLNQQSSSKNKGESGGKSSEGTTNETS